MWSGVIPIGEWKIETGKSWRGGGKITRGKIKIKKLKRGGGKKKELSGTDSLGYSVICIDGDGFFGWSEYYLIPMMEVKARKKRELSAEPVGKTHRCIPRYIRALGEKHETSTAFNSIHTSLARSLSPARSLSLFLSPLVPFLDWKIRFQKVIKHGRCQWRSQWKCAKDAFKRIFSSVSKCARM